MDDAGFISFILNENTNYSQRSWVEAYNSLRRNPAQVSTFLNSREVSGAFVAGFELYGTRIADFLQQIPRYTPRTAVGTPAKEELDLKQAMGGNIVRRVLLPLLCGDYQHLHNRDALFEFLVSAVRLSERNCLDQIASQLGEIPYLLGKMISEDRNSDLLREWASFLITARKALQNWTETVVNLAGNCESDHGVREKIERWELLKALKIHLYQAKHQFETPYQNFNPQSRAPMQGGFRKLSIDEKKSVGTRRSSVTSGAMIISPEALTLLESLDISVPHSERTLLRAIDDVEATETFNIMQAVLSTFPCRLCFARGYGKASNISISTTQANFEQRLEELDLDSFEGLLGSNLGIWKISLSAQAMKDLKQSKREGNFLHIKEKLEALASGDWARKSVAKPISDNNGRFKVRVFQAWYGSNGRILWQVDVGFDEKHKADCQIVRVWRIGDVKEMLSSLDSVYRAQQMFTATRIANCKKNVIDQTRNKKIPAVFGDSEQDTVEESNPRTIDERTPQDMLISGKFHTLTSTMLDSIIHDQSRSDFPFDVTGKEVEIIKHFRTATFILGRSGTGKTSCLLYKLLSRYLARNLIESETPIRQLLLTRSEPLARKLESEVQLLIDTQLLRVKAGFDSAEDELEAPTHTRDEMDEETTEDLFSLQKEDFPLVCTFGHFLKRLENTIKAHDRKDFSISIGGNRPGRAGSTAHSRQMVDFSIFKAAYWQQFPTALKAGLEPDLVFTEIMGVIKGAASLLSGLKPLSRDDYRSKSSRLAPTFAKEGERDTVYNLFEHYEYKKKQNGDYDGIDRVKAILGDLTENIGLRRRLEAIFEEVYVDEVQDQRPLEIELLLNLVQNPRGIHFAGDSAQCISKDSTFRFANVKALFYDHFSGSSFARIDPRLAKPELFSLSRNFRSHQGILSLASFVMELLWKGFPDMVDKLPPEIGQYLGPKPIIFVGSELIELLEMAGSSNEDDNTVEQRTKGQGESTEVKKPKNQQVIIVRDQQIQEQLQTKLGDGSLVFTILQSKGMEYDDVFLFDFFSSSPCLQSFKSLQELLPAGSNPLYGATHMAMCSELKNLYVAITRPRNRLWILESNSSFILELFTTRVPKPLVKVKHFSPEDFPELKSEVRPASATSAREWIETGEQCMERGIFDQALKCFKNAENTQRILWAEASIAEQKGKECRAKGDVVGLKSHFKEASGFFLAIAMKERAASCLEALGEFAEAAELWSEKRRHEKAAGLFERAHMYEKAADEYHKAGVVYKALQALYNGKLFDQLVHSLHKYRNEIVDGDRKTYARECNIHLRQGKIAKELWEMTFNTFTSDSEKEDFLKEFKHKKELLEFYLVRGRFNEAFKYSVKTGDFEEALELIINQKSGHGGNVGETEHEGDFPLTEVFKYAQTRKLVSSISKSSTSVDLSYDQRFAGTSWSCAWADLVTAANGYFKNGIQPERAKIEKAWIREYLDTIISMKIEYFLKSGEDFVDLPLEYVCGLAEIAKSLSQDMGIPKPVLLCLGVLPIPDESNSYMVLSWSNLPMDAESPRTIDYKNIMKKITTYISKQIVNARSAIDRKARVLWEKFSKMLKCDACLIREKWDQPDKQQGQGSKCSHEIPSDAQFLKLMQGLAKLCRLYDELGEPSLDYWLENLLSQMTYNSAFLQSAGVVITAVQTCKSDIYSNVLQRLQRNFLNNWRPWETKNAKDDFALLLENYHVGCNLNIEQGDLKSALNRRTMTGAKQPQRGQQWTPRPTPKPTPDFAYIAFDRYQLLRSLSRTKPSQFSTGIFCDNLDHLLQALEVLRKETNRLSFYHGSFISIYEDILTFLLFSTRRTDVIIPRSWTKLYMPHWEPVFKATSDLEQCCYLNWLFRLVGSFCDLVTDLEGRPHGKAYEKELLARRSVDLLAICLINMGTIEPRPLRYEKVWDKVQKVFGHKGLKADTIRDVPADLLVENTARAFQFYNGKDSILAYVREGRLSKWVESLDMVGIQLKILPIRQHLAPDFPRYQDKRLKAGFIVQAQRAKALRRREHMASATGRALYSIQALCRAHGRKKSSLREFFKFAMVMVTEGLELWLLLDTADAKLRDTIAVADRMRVSEKYAAELSNFNKELYSESWHLFDSEGPNAFDLGMDDLQRKFKEGLETIGSLSDRISELMQRLQKPPEDPKTTKKGKGKLKDKPKETPKAESKDGPENGPKESPKETQKGKSKEGWEGGSPDEQTDGVKTGKSGKHVQEGGDPEKTKAEEKEEVQETEARKNEGEIDTPQDQLSKGQKEKGGETKEKPKKAGSSESTAQKGESSRGVEQKTEKEENPSKASNTKSKKAKRKSKKGRR